MKKRKTLAELQTENRRGAMLYFLADDAQYSMNTYLLLSALSDVGYARYLNEVNDDAAWMEEQGLVTREETEDMTIITLTRRGLDVAQGALWVPGVKRSRLEI